ncbi:hypothetical protein L484_027224 [Morus notabilis]|uniref:Uncharacterized protein n=1 Tax=Morus notabilis TaxID=981085 RepID=W9SQF5_9ROSA|nr:hypothetical protein L484_027224 [Morus notabilis]
MMVDVANLSHKSRLEMPDAAVTERGGFGFPSSPSRYRRSTLVALSLPDPRLAISVRRRFALFCKEKIRSRTVRSRCAPRRR